MKTQKKRNEQENIKFKNFKWVLLITVWTFFLSVLMSFFSDLILKSTNIFVSFIVLLVIIFIGIIFDIIGIAITAVDEKPFHSMASAKVNGSFEAIILIKNASKVSNICNDVIGDICGIVAGASVAFIIFELSSLISYTNTALLTVILSSFAASLTVGGKAIGKEVAITHSKSIIFFCGKLIHFIQNIFKKGSREK